MTTSTTSKRSAPTVNLPASGRPPKTALEAEFQRTIAIARERGMLNGGAAGFAKILKNGVDVAALGKVRFQWMDITPAMARAWLQNNVRNRSIAEDTVKAYARDMIAGQWVPTHQGLAFNDKDELIDGQHRLEAIILANLTVRMMVAFGLPSKIDGKQMTTMDAVDRGRTRSVADQLKIQHGMANGGIVAAVTASLGGLCFGERTRRLSVGQTLEIYHAFEPAIVYIIAHRSKEYGLRSAGVLSGFAFALMTECDKGPERPAGVEPGKPKFWESPLAIMFSAVNGEGDHLPKPGSVTELLRNFLISDEARLFTHALNRGLAELVLQAAWLQTCCPQKKVAKLEPGLDGAEHFRKLQSERVAKIAALFTLPKV